MESYHLEIEGLACDLRLGTICLLHSGGGGKPPYVAMAGRLFYDEEDNAVHVRRIGDCVVRCVQQTETAWRAA